MKAKDKYNKGKEFEDKDMWKEALKCYTECVQADTKHQEGWYYKGYCENQLGNYQDAVQSLNQVLKINPKYQFAWYHKGLTFIHLGKYEEGVKCFNEALLIDPKDEYALEEKGTALNELRRYEEAVECLNQAIAIEPKARMYFHLGNSYSGLGKKKEALENYKLCEKIDSNYPYVKEKIKQLEKKWYQF